MIRSDATCHATSPDEPPPHASHARSRNLHRVSKSTLEKLRVTGGGSPYIRVGRVVLYDPNELDCWLALHRHRSTADYRDRS